MDTSRLSLTVYGGLLVPMSRIEEFMAAHGSPALKSTSAAMYLCRWMNERDLSCIRKVACRLKRPTDEDNPLMTLLYIGEKRVTFADVDFTDSGVVPKVLPRASDAVRERVRGWLGLDPAAEEHDVSELADRFAWVRSNIPDVHIRRLFEVLPTLLGTAREDLQFSLVFRQSDVDFEARVRLLLQEDSEHAQM